MDESGLKTFDQETLTKLKAPRFQQFQRNLCELRKRRVLGSVLQTNAQLASWCHV